MKRTHFVSKTFFKCSKITKKSRRLGDSYREIIMKKKSLGFLSNKVRRSSSDDVSITPPP
ncbi:hypothetical protein DW714_02210 [Streptococcus anginosus]|nr:hypothetical protein DW714_02210 [Streptococcus anginosus]